MSKVQKPDGEIIDDRRGNGARLKLATRDWIWIGTLVVTVIIYVVNISFTTAANCEIIREQKVNITNNIIKIGKMETSIFSMEKDMEYIRNRVDDIYKRVK